MREGLTILVTRGTWYGLTRMGWLRRIAGDEWELVGSRVLMRRGSPVSLVKIAEAKKLPRDHELLPPSKMPEAVHRLQMVRNVDIHADDIANWAELLPRPKDWHLE